MFGHREAYLRDNDLRVIGGWRWLESHLMYREIMRRERQKREEESTQLDLLSALRIAAWMRNRSGQNDLTKWVLYPLVSLGFTLTQRSWKVT